MITVAIMAELLEEYTVALARITERLLPQRRSSIHGGLQGLREFRLPTAYHQDGDSSSFIVYF